MLKKVYDAYQKTCKVTFTLPADLQAESASLCGDFNEWNNSSHPMKKQKDGSFKIALTLEAGKRYSFRYLLNGETWENDWQADDYNSNEFGSDNSVIDLQPS